MYRAPPSIPYLVPGVIAASIGLFGNIALDTAGPIALALDRMGATGLSPASRVRIFALTLKRTSPVMIAIGFLAASLSLFPTFAYPNPVSKPYLRTAAAAFLALTPYSAFTLFDINKQLVTLDGALGNTEDGSLRLPEAKGRRGVKLIEDWAFWAGWRTCLVAVGWSGLVLGLGKELQLL